MGRIIFGGSNSGAGGNTITTTNVASNSFSIPAGEDLAVNSLVVVGEDGFAYKANPLLSLSQLNNNVAGLGLVAGLTDLGGNTSFGLGDVAQRNILTFPSGEVVFAFSGNGAASNYDVNVKIKNITAQDMLPPVIFGTASTSVNAIGVERLTASTFVLWWLLPSSLNFAIIGKGGSQVKAATVGPTTSGTSRSMNMCRSLPNGDFVFFYSAADGSARFTRYNSLGVVQGGEVTVSAGAISADKLNVIPLAAGGFICQFWKGDTGVWQFARYTSAGAIVGAVVSAPNSASSPGGANHDQRGVELDNGTVVVLRRGSSNNWFADLYGPTNTLLRSIDLGASTAAGLSGAVVKTPSGFATFMGYAAGNLYCRSFLSSGDQVGLEAAVGANNLQYETADTFSNSVCVATTPSGFVVLQSGSNNVNASQALLVISSSLVRVGSVVVTKASGPDFIYGACLAMLGNLAIVGFRQAGTTPLSPKLTVYSTSRSSVFGVAQSTSAKGTLVPVGTQGAYSLSEKYALSGAFDSRTNAAPGNRGTVAGASALLLGTSI